MTPAGFVEAKGPRVYLRLDGAVDGLDAICDLPVATGDRSLKLGGVGVKGERGYDPAQCVVGRKRHALTDTDGRLLLATVSPANLHASHGGMALLQASRLQASRRLWPFLAHCFADQAYQGGAGRLGHHHHGRSRQTRQGPEGL